MYPPSQRPVRYVYVSGRNQLLGWARHSLRGTIAKAGALSTTRVLSKGKHDVYSLRSVRSTSEPRCAPTLYRPASQSVVSKCNRVRGYCQSLCSIQLSELLRSLYSGVLPSYGSLLVANKSTAATTTTPASDDHLRGRYREIRLG